MKNKILHTSLITCLVCLFAGAKAQTYSAKAYTGIEYRLNTHQYMQWDSGSSYHLEQRQSRNARISFPTLAFTISSDRGFFHEIQLGGINMGSTKIQVQSERNPGATSYQLHKFAWVNLAYEFNYRVFKSKSDKWSFFAGTNVQATASGYIHKPNNPTSFHTSRLDLTTLFSIVPRVQYKLNDKWLADLNFNYVLLATDNSRTRMENPAFSKEQQIGKFASSEGLPKIYTAKLGIGYTF